MRQQQERAASITEGDAVAAVVCPSVCTGVHNCVGGGGISRVFLCTVARPAAGLACLYSFAHACAAAHWAVPFQPPVHAGLACGVVYV